MFVPLSLQPLSSARPASSHYQGSLQVRQVNPSRGSSSSVFPDIGGKLLIFQSEVIQHEVILSKCIVCFIFLSVNMFSVVCFFSGAVVSKIFVVSFIFFQTETGVTQGSQKMAQVVRVDREQYLFS